MARHASVVGRQLALARRVRPVLAIVAAALLLIGIGATPAAAADGPTMTARVLLQGHARLGSWIAIEVHLVNDGPSIVGELRLQGGSQGGTRFATAVQLDSPSDKTWVLHAQPPSFGQQLEVQLVANDQVVLRQKVAVTIHDASQLVVGVIAENPPKIVGSLNLPAVQNQGSAVIVPLTVQDLPTRIEAWSALDRLIWQDVDASTLGADQLTALRGWLALGGRLVIVGGTEGVGALAGFPDDLLPYRPAATMDVAPASLTSLIGTVPAGATDVPALAGELTHGRALATSGDRVVAAQAPYGSGSVTILGVDPTVGWLGESNAGRSIWPSLIPARADGSVAMTDDTQIVSAVGNLPSLALPPLGGLLLLLFGYVALIGPINYLILRRIDRREWAWITMPVLIVAFVIGAYSFGSALRGSSIIVNEVGIVRGAPDAIEGSAQVYLGVFSPSRGTYQVAVPGGALLSSPISGDVFGGTNASLDILQGDPPGPSRVRNLSVGFGSLRTIRAESQATVPKVHSELALVDGTLTGTIRNDSQTTLEKPAIVLGSNVKVLRDVPPGETVQVSLRIANLNQFGQSLSDRIFGQVFFGSTGSTTENARRDQTRHLVVDQLTYDPQFGNFGRLSSQGPVLLAWGRDAILDVAVEGQAANRVSNVLYYVPLAMGIHGGVTFSGDLLTTTMTESDAAFFSKDPTTMSFGQGTATVVYRPLAFEGTLSTTHVRMGISCCPDGSVTDLGGAPVEPIPDACIEPDPKKRPDACPVPRPDDQFDGLPEVEVFDRTGAGTWHRLPHLEQGTTYDLKDPAKYVDPSTGAVLVRFVNERQDPISVYLGLSIQGTIR
ncbi:MAG TPA: hypothetical protein VFI34_10390 [Candidatus Limnocylindrales bacterium]|nr:hypothetical protein [Candidatus Limnocylindrales bacterium]